MSGAGRLRALLRLAPASRTAPAVAPRPPARPAAAHANSPRTRTASVPAVGAATDGAGRLKAWAELLRVSALSSVPGDALAGAAAAGCRPNRGTALAVGTSLCLYEAGMALNDWSDREEDARERPDRPLPSGRISPRAALGAAVAFTGTGLGLAALAGRTAFGTATALAGTVWAYDIGLKHTPAAPATMATARALDLLLGATATRARAVDPPALGRRSLTSRPLPRAGSPAATPPVPPTASRARAGAPGAVPPSPARTTASGTSRARIGRPSAVSPPTARGASGDLLGRSGPLGAPRARTGSLGAAPPVPGRRGQLSPQRSARGWGGYGEKPPVPQPVHHLTWWVPRPAGAVSARTPWAARPVPGRGDLPGRRAREAGGAGESLLAAALLGAHTLAVTTVSRHETTGGSSRAPLTALGTVAAVTAATTWPRESGTPAHVAAQAATAAVFAATAARPLAHAALNPSPPLLQRAVGGGIRAMIPLQATLAARAGAPTTAAALLWLLPVARRLSRKVSPT